MCLGPLKSLIQSNAKAVGQYQIPIFSIQGAGGILFSLAWNILLLEHRRYRIVIFFHAEVLAGSLVSTRDSGGFL